MSLLELVAVVIILGVLTTVAAVSWRHHVETAHDAEAMAAVDAIGRGVGMVAASAAGQDFDYSEATVAAAVKMSPAPTNPIPKVSNGYGSYGWALGTDPTSTETRSVVVMKSSTGACAVGVFAANGAKKALVLARVATCVADGTVLAGNADLSRVAALPKPAPPPALVVVKAGRASSGASYVLTWDRPAAEVTSYRVWTFQAPTFADAPALAGVVSAPGPGWTQVATLAGTDTSYAVPLTHSDPSDGANGRWLLLYVTALNDLGESPPSNLVPVIDGFVNGRGLWFACRAVTGDLRVLVQVPDSWPYPMPASWWMDDQHGDVLRSGVVSLSGPLFVDVAPKSKVGDLHVSFADGTVLLLSPATGSAGADNSHGGLPDCPVT